MKHCWDGLRKLLITWGTHETSIYICIFFFRTHDSIVYLYAGGGFMMNDEDIKERKIEEEIAFKKKQEKREILKQKYSNVYESLDNKDYECYAICEKEKFFTVNRNKSNCLYIGKTSNFASRRKSYRDFKKPNNEIVNKLVKKFPKKARDGIILKLINNIRVKRFKFKCLQDEKYLDYVEGYLIQRINPLLNTSKSNGRKTLYKSRSFTKFVLNGGLDKK